MPDSQKPMRFEEGDRLPNLGIGAALNPDPTSRLTKREAKIANAAYNLGREEALREVYEAAAELRVFMFGRRRPDGRVNLWHGVADEDDENSEWAHYDVADSLIDGLESAANLSPDVLGDEQSTPKVEDSVVEKPSAFDPVIPADDGEWVLTELDESEESA